MKGVWGVCRPLSFACEDDTAGDLLFEVWLKRPISDSSFFKLPAETGSVIHLVQEEKEDKHSRMTTFSTEKTVHSNGTKQL